VPFPAAHAIIVTHTPRHLRRTLLGVTRQSVAPATITVSCDSDDPAIADVVRTVACETGRAVLLVLRPHQGESRSSQVRNNAVRALLDSESPPSPGDVLWFLDGDCIPAPDCLERIVSFPPGRLVVAFRIDLTPEQTDAITDEGVGAGSFVTPTAAQLATLAKRHRRYQRHALMRRLGVGKAHKPKLLSANFGVTLRDYLVVNGFDETYVGYGQEDDDLGRRLYAAGVRPAVAVATALAYHQYHPTRAPQAWEKSPNAERFAWAFAVRCERGVADEAAQPEPVVRLESARSA
jgi:hypothetical protein